MPFLAALAFAAMPQQITETVTVRRIVLEIRVVDRRGKPILGLQPSDFDVRLDRQPVEVASATWVPETAEGRRMAGQSEIDLDYLDALASASPEFLQATSGGRLFILFFQTDFARNASRTGGQMAFLPYARKIVDDLPPEDRVAVMSFDSHLHLHLDFTRDRSQIHRAMDHTLLIGEPPAPAAVVEPSLAECLDRDGMLRAASSEQALLVIANAIADIPGEKQIVILGYGLGERVGHQIVMRPEWAETERRLVRTGVVVNAIYTPIYGGELAVGLQQATADTGGFFMVRGNFPQQAVDRFAGGELSGHYDIEIKAPEDLQPGKHHAKVLVKAQRLTFNADVTLE
jgi:VWFA-related protein